MLFPSLPFLFLFFPIFLLLYSLLPFRRIVIILFSLLFYTWGEGYFVMLLLFTVLINYVTGNCIVKYIDCPKTSKLWLGVGISLNLLILGYFKYCSFFSNSVLNLNLPDQYIPHLPLGISFFIFQSISYLFDVFKKETRAANSFSELTLYITMFPQLIAGPIVRFSTIVANQHDAISVHQVRDGLFLFAGGLAQKILIANKAAQIADTAFGLPLDQINCPVSWIGAFSYTIQIFFDFSGYSAMAIGIGLILGFRFPENFNYPYISRSVTEFWRRWHISLSAWFKDYLYIPLGGNRKGAVRTYANLFCVFVLCGLWHGAAWTFLAWGIYHGILLIVERHFLGRLLRKVPSACSLVYTVFLVMFGWILFRSENFSQSFVFTTALFSYGDFTLPTAMLRVLTRENLFFCALGIILSTPVVPMMMTSLRVKPAKNSQYQYGLNKTIIMGSVSLVLFLVSCMYIYSNTYNPFIYFRF